MSNVRKAEEVDGREQAGALTTEIEKFSSGH
jgi:hypothetical protein